MHSGVSAPPGLQQPSPRPTTPGPACNWHIHAYAHQPPDRSISIMPSPMHMPPCHPAPRAGAGGPGRGGGVKPGGLAEEPERAP